MLQMQGRSRQLSGERGECISTIPLGSATDSATAVSHIFMSIRKIYSACFTAFGSNDAARTNNFSLLRRQVEDLLADSQYASATELQHRKRRKDQGGAYDICGRMNLQHPPAISLRRQNEQNIYSTSRKRKAASSYNQIEVALPLGKVALHLTKDGSDDRIIGIRMFFIPIIDPLLQLKGISTTFIHNTLTGNLTTRSLTSFRTLSETSQVFAFIEEGNIDGVRHLLSTRQICPTDRDMDGDSLLYVRAIST